MTTLYHKIVFLFLEEARIPLIWFPVSHLTHSATIRLISLGCSWKEAANYRSGISSSHLLLKKFIRHVTVNSSRSFRRPSVPADLAPVSLVAH